MAESRQLPPPEKAALTLGFMRLTDSAPLIVARERGLFEQYGLDVALVREVSWANLRDKLAVGTLDAAPLLSPLLLMSSYGAGGLRASLLTGLSLGLNGNAITLSRELWGRLADGTNSPNALTMARQLGERVRKGETGVLTLATVHAFSMHSFLLRLWLRAGGIDPDRDVRILVLPPEQMCDSLARGVIDGFCVGEPWNTVAVQQGIGAVAATGYGIWNNAPEKVLAVTERWHHLHPGTHLRLRLALMEACQWLQAQENRLEAAAMLQGYLDLPVTALQPSLTGDFSFVKDGATVSMPDFHVFSRYQAGFPWRSHALWQLQASTDLLGRPVAEALSRQLVQQCYRPHLYRQAARHLGLLAPEADSKAEGRHCEDLWEYEPGIALGADLIIDGGRFTPSNVDQ